MRTRAMLTVAAATLFADQCTKWLVIRALPIGASVPPDGAIAITHVRNTGALWGSMQGMNVVFILISVLAIAALLRWRSEFRTTASRTALGLILGGIAGNLIDRVLLGSVTDFLAVGWWPVFNIADAAIVTGVAVVVLTGFTSGAPARPARILPARRGTSGRTGTASRR